MSKLILDGRIQKSDAGTDKGCTLKYCGLCLIPSGKQGFSSFTFLILLNTVQQTLTKKQWTQWSEINEWNPTNRLCMVYT